MDKLTINMKMEDKINLKTEHVFHNVPKKSPLTYADAKGAQRLLCKSSMLLGAYEDSLSSMLSSHDFEEGFDKDTATSVCQTVKNLNDKVHVLKDAVADFLMCRDQLRETQSGFVRENFKSFSIYLESFDFKTLNDNAAFLSKSFTEKPLDIPALVKSPYGCCCSNQHVISKATSLLKDLVTTYENSSL